MEIIPYLSNVIVSRRKKIDQLEKREKTIHLEYAKQSTASSIIMKFSCAWYFKSFLILPVVKFQTSIKPSTDPVTKYCPSGENAEHSIWDLAPNLICLLISVGYFSSSCSRIAALPRNKSIWVPEKKKIEKSLKTEKRGQIVFSILVISLEV